jgi:hypothetical protein
MQLRSREVMVTAMVMARRNIIMAVRADRITERLFITDLQDIITKGIITDL